MKRIPFSKIREELQKRYSKKHKDFGDRITKDLIIDTSISCIDASADWAYNIMLDRGKYMPYNSRTITGKRVRLKKQEILLSGLNGGISLQMQSI